MKMIRTISLTVAVCCVSGCAMAKRAGHVAMGATAWLAGAMIDGLLDDDETPIEQHRREQHQRKWKQAWRDNPDVNPAMTHAFKDDYE